MAKRVRMSAQERREQLIGVARSSFAERGYEASSIEEIAERAGVSKPVVYQHFGGKEGIYAVVVDREVQRLTAAIARSFDAARPRLIAIEAAENFLTYIEEHEEGFRVLVRDAPIGVIQGSFATVIADVAARSEALLRDEFGRRGHDERAAPMYARMLVGAVALVGEWWLDAKEPDREVVAAHVVNLLWNGLGQLQPVDPEHVKEARERGDSSLVERQRDEVAGEDPGAAPVVALDDARDPTPDDAAPDDEEVAP